MAKELDAHLSASASDHIDQMAAQIRKAGEDAEYLKEQNQHLKETVEKLGRTLPQKGDYTYESDHVKKADKKLNEHNILIENNAVEISNNKRELDEQYLQLKEAIDKAKVNWKEYLAFSLLIGILFTGLLLYLHKINCDQKEEIRHVKLENEQMKEKLRVLEDGASKNVSRLFDLLEIEKEGVLYLKKESGLLKETARSLESGLLKETARSLEEETYKNVSALSDAISKSKEEVKLVNGENKKNIKLLEDETHKNISILSDIISKDKEEIKLLFEENKEKTRLLEDETHKKMSSLHDKINEGKRKVAHLSEESKKIGEKARLLEDETHKLTSSLSDKLDCNKREITHCKEEIMQIKEGMRHLENETIKNISSVFDQKVNGNFTVVANEIYNNMSLLSYMIRVIKGDIKNLQEEDVLMREQAAGSVEGKLYVILALLLIGIITVISYKILNSNQKEFVKQAREEKHNPVQ